MNPDLTILYDTIRWEEKSLLKSANDMGVKTQMTDCKDMVLNLESSPKDMGVVLQRCVSYYRNVHSTAALEGLGVIIINPQITGMLAGNKLFTHMLLRKSDIPTPKASVAFSVDGALTAIEEQGYPGIIKPTVGSWGRLISKLNDPEIARSILESRERMYPIYHIHYIEEMVKRPPRDIRAIVVGGEIVGAIYRSSGENMWKTNTALGGKATECRPSSEMRELCAKGTEAVHGEIVGVDLMEGPDGLVIHEINNTTEFKNVARVTKADISGAIIRYASRRARR